MHFRLFWSPKPSQALCVLREVKELGRRAYAPPPLTEDAPPAPLVHGKNASEVPQHLEHLSPYRGLGLGRFGGFPDLWGDLWLQLCKKGARLWARNTLHQ